MKLTTLLLVAIVFLNCLTQITSGGRNRRRERKRQKNREQEVLELTSSEGHVVEMAESNVSSESNELETTNVSPTSRSSKEGRGSRRGQSKRRGKKSRSILKTSVKAKIVTEKRYLKKDWCKSQPVKQHIRTTSNCHAVIINQFCYGQCNSFYIPKDITIDDQKQDVTPDYFKSCAFCKPKTEEWISVRLRCKRSMGRKMPRFITKRVKRVKGCTCIAVPDLEKLVEGGTASESEEGAPQLRASSTNATAQVMTSNR